MPAEYLDTTSPREVVWHLDVARRLDVPGHVSVDPRNRRPDSSWPGRIETGFLLAVSRPSRQRRRGHGRPPSHPIRRNRPGHLPRRGRSNRRARCRGTMGSGRRRSCRRARRTRCPRAGDRERIRTYRRHAKTRAPSRCARIGSGRNTVIEVRAPDRIGLLTTSSRRSTTRSSTSTLAKIDTMGGEARDVFHVRRSGAGSASSPSWPPSRPGSATASGLIAPSGRRMRSNRSRSAVHSTSPRMRTIRPRRIRSRLCLARRCGSG